MQIPTQDADAQTPQQVPPGQASQTAPGSSVLEPSCPIPEQFMSIVRRSKKQLLRKPDTILLETYNAFVTALNTGVSEDNLTDCGDDLEDAYHDARK